MLPWFGEIEGKEEELRGEKNEISQSSISNNYLNVPLELLYLSIFIHLDLIVGL